MLLWLPYFFLNLGYTSNATYISLVFPVSFTIGAICVHPIKKIVKENIGVIFLIFLILATLSLLGMCLLGDDSSEIILYFLLVFFVGLFMSGFCSYTETTDLQNRTEGPR